ncbi:bifunctional hydroxymethylpyrimidine kinase/phosphomethylpyrimidine kinase [Shewanella halotolerans]|uniref:bifunctional hydroxymethylpyrimidine kinase/phosphomethylpyrimidine kinase n=1 Tax=Shewanella halotolerans TaxID=2864204 RepID=UPI001C661AC1|nr:bifunctional hydroxymethylpyrimidine kinase/phosphomethylpyrimidine kinase [Shewanella halotolerans]QYJ91720.1 bifunctional hydroxymethylpyrimidine kinase/phosphomethylpyrimidine kinase [Shewanella halotolerans]
MSAEKPIVWTIAGSDSGSGAGIQADLATMADLGCHGCSVITCVTAQNSVAVNGVEPVSEAILLAQLDTLLADLPPKAIKIGLLANQRQINLVADWLATHIAPLKTGDGLPISIILDPVMVASCGDALTGESAVQASAQTKTKLKTKPKTKLKTKPKHLAGLDFSPFAKLLTLMTPNASEFGKLVGKETASSDEMLGQASALSKRLACNLLITGGDKGSLWRSDRAEDLLICNAVAHTSPLHQHTSFRLSGERVDNPNHHGSGCTLSSAIASFLAQGLVLHDAILLAKTYVVQGIASAKALGAGAGPLARTGWPSGLVSLPRITELTGGTQLSSSDSASDCSLLGSSLSSSAANFSRYSFPRLSFLRLKRPIGVYPVVDNLNTLEQVLAAGATTAQLRIKLEDDGQAGRKGEESKQGKGKQEEGQGAAALEAQIQAAIALGRKYDAQVFINDHWQLALKHGAFGIHLGQEDLFEADLNRIAEAGIALGVSSHGVFELALASQLNPSYLALGHIFPTPTKSMPSNPQGLSMLARMVALWKPDCPRVAIGGIDASRLERVKATNVEAVAVVRAVTQADSPGEAYKQLARTWEKAYVTQ